MSKISRTVRGGEEVARNVRKGCRTLDEEEVICGSEIRTRDKNSLRTPKIKYLRQTVGYTLLDHKGNKDVLEELHVTSLEEELCTYKHNTNTFMEWKITGSVNNF
jgi:hypothetical protein